MIFGKDGPLNSQVEQAEQALLQRRRQLRLDLSSLHTAVDERITAPDALLWSAATGFAIGEVTKKRGYTGEQAQGARKDEDGEHEERPSTLQLIMRYVAIARPILAMASTWLGPLMHRAAEEAHAEAEALRGDGDMPYVPTTTANTDEVTLARAEQPA